MAGAPIYRNRRVVRLASAPEISRFVDKRALSLYAGVWNEVTPIIQRFLTMLDILRVHRGFHCLTVTVLLALSPLLLADPSVPDHKEPHWAYRPLSEGSSPETVLPGWENWCETPIDLFILNGLATKGLHPSPPADRRTLLRRVYFDLIGMPPTYAEIKAFEGDEDPHAYENVVDRLLALPHFGERWARHWMDVVHFAETHGHDQDRPRENAWPYRDYLIRSFNEDRSYARFVAEQIAGDVLSPDDPTVLSATGFLAAGPWDESSLMSIQSDSVDYLIGHYLDRDDMVTTTMSTFVSSSVQCARCHEHKLDPISQEEYYSLQAVFAGIDKANRPYDRNPAIADRRRHLNDALRDLQTKRDNGDISPADPAVIAEVSKWEESIRSRNVEWRVIEPAKYESLNGATLTLKPDGSLLSGGERPDKDTYTVVAHTDLEEITGIRLEAMTDESLPHTGPGRQDNGNLHINELLVTLQENPDTGAAEDPTIEGDGDDVAVRTPVKLRDPQASYNQHNCTIARAIDGDTGTFWGIYPEIKKPHAAVFTLENPIHAGKEGTTLAFEIQQDVGAGHLIGRLRLSVTGSSPPFGASVLPTHILDILAIDPEERNEGQRAKLITYQQREKILLGLAALPDPEFLYCGTNKFRGKGGHQPVTTPRPVHVLARGNVQNPGPLAEPGSVTLIAGLPSRFDLKDPNDESGRRAALAAWLTDRRNVLTWRSIVNRLWHHHFGRGIVDTPNEFGRMGGSPSHPQLLDWLAMRLLESGGSLKKIHRLIVTSAAYRQSSHYDSPFAASDGDNRYLWRMNRRRLDAESIRDAVLRISRKLDPRMGGPSVKQFIQTKGPHVTPRVDYINFDVDDPANYRRSVYRFIFRTLPDPFMESLDCPDASLWTPKRNESMTALQALSMLNDKFIVRQSEHIAEQALRVGPGAKEHVQELYRLVLSREPNRRESTVVEHYAEKHGLASACRYILNSNEFLFVD